MSDISDDEPNHKRRRGVAQRIAVRLVQRKRRSQQSPAEDLNCKCHLKCKLKHADEMIREQWETFYSLESKNTQNTYLQASMEVMPVKRRRKNRRSNENNEQASRKCAYCLLDLRRKSRSGNALPGNVCVGIHQHIEEFDVKETHYGRKPKKYLDPRIDVAKMHDQYAELMLNASKCGRFTVYHLTSDDVLSFKKLWPKSYKKMTNSDESSGRNVPKENKQPFKVSKYKQFLYNKDTPGKLVASEYIGGIATFTFTLLKTANLPELPAEKAYLLGKVRINQKRNYDIEKLMEHTVGYEAFYDTIIQWPTTDHELPEPMPKNQTFCSIKTYCSV
ncbi:hypothetical protein WA026_018791 [Henosepilachna vigintioctopunctata]|uniref:Uncharacterized protein n=1 Tax=Henosepilachna vigintioctopunctata TaxID=420089 RepID=A0AAW1TX49_9CUCU